MAVKHILCEWARPIIRCLPFGRIRALALVGGRAQDDASWETLPHPRRVFFDHDLGAYIAADLREWGGRWHYFTGRYYDQVNRLLARKLLRPGDTYIDIGANYGIQSLAAARIVGPRGQVIAIEPHPATFATLQAHMAINGISNVRSYNVGLSDKPGSLTLANDSNHPGTFSFRKLDHARTAVEVPVAVGDELLATIPMKPETRVLVKIDTEGHEMHVLRGLRNLIAAPNAAFVVEITDAWLRATGSSAQTLYDEMHAAGHASFGLAVVYPWLRRQLRLAAQPKPLPGQHDVLFAHPDFLSTCGVRLPGGAGPDSLETTSQD